MKKKLQNYQRDRLIARHRREREGRVRDRIKAVLLIDEGYSYREVAKILLLDDETIRRYVEDYKREQKLHPEHEGSKSALDAEETEELLSHLEENTYLYVKDICHHVKEKYHVIYSISGMTKWLQAHAFRYKKPHQVPAKANKDEQAVHIKKYEKLKKEAGEKEPIYFMDGVHPQHQTRLAYGWIRKGKRKEIAMTAKQYRVNYIGGINLQGHQLIYRECKKIDAEQIKLFFKQIRASHKSGEKIHVILDNAGYHHSKDIIGYVEGLNIRLHYLPPYSPNLNPIERLWKIMHEKVTYNQYYEKFSDFSEAIRDFFKTIGRKKTILRSRITDNFQVRHSPLFAK
jgi:transposase